MTITSFRNVAIVAHVDHGKTTLVDAMFRQSGAFEERAELVDRVMDSGDLEREKGITILAKNTAVHKHHADGSVTVINVIDTPGHADFGGEVERGLSMVDGVVLLVDASEGPLPQTRFVLRKALAASLPVILRGQQDRPSRRPHRRGRLREPRPAARPGVRPRRRGRRSRRARPRPSRSVRLGPRGQGVQGSARERSRTGRREPRRAVRGAAQLRPRTQGQRRRAAAGPRHQPRRLRVPRPPRAGPHPQRRAAKGQTVAWIARRRRRQARSRSPNCSPPIGVERQPAEKAVAGDIVAVAGIPDIMIGDTLADLENPVALPRITVDEPAISVTIGTNTSPLVGRVRGHKLTARMVKSRLDQELVGNVSLRVLDIGRPDAWEVQGRGELALAILVEQMRREGFELTVGKPQVVTRQVDGKVHEPFEELTIDSPEEYLGAITQLLAARKGKMVQMTNHGAGWVRMEFIVPSRGLIGFRTDFLTETRGTGIANAVFHGYAPWAGEIRARHTGSLVSDRAGTVTPFAMIQLADRGTFFVEPGADTYEGMVVGINPRQEDLDINVTREKKLTNMRQSSADVMETLAKPMQARARRRDGVLRRRRVRGGHPRGRARAQGAPRSPPSVPVSVRAPRPATRLPRGSPTRHTRPGGCTFGRSPAEGTFARGFPEPSGISAERRRGGCWGSTRESSRIRAEARERAAVTALLLAVSTAMLTSCTADPPPPVESTDSPKPTGVADREAARRRRHRRRRQRIQPAPAVGPVAGELRGQRPRCCRARSGRCPIPPARAAALDSRLLAGDLGGRHVAGTVHRHVPAAQRGAVVRRRAHRRRGLPLPVAADDQRARRGRPRRLRLIEDVSVVRWRQDGRRRRWAAVSGVARTVHRPAAVASDQGFPRRLRDRTGRERSRCRAGTFTSSRSTADATRSCSNATTGSGANRRRPTRS